MSEENGLEGSIAQRFPHLAPDDDLLKIVAWCEKLEGKIDTFGDSFNTWTRAILSQSELATQQNQSIMTLGSTLNKTGKTNDELSITLKKFGEGLITLQTEFALLKNMIEALEKTWQTASDSTENFSLDLKKLQTQIEPLSRKLENLEKSIGVKPKNETIFGLLDKTDPRIETLSAELNTERVISRIAFGVIIALLLMQSLWLALHGNRVNRQFEVVNEQVDRTNRNVNTVIKQLQNRRR